MQPTRFDRLLDACFDGESRRARSLAVALYAILALLSLMQLASAGAVGRIAQQPLGTALLAALFAAAAGYALLVVGDALLGARASARAPGLSDALLHACVGGLGLGALFGRDLFTERLSALLVGGAGLALLGAGLLLAVLGRLAPAAGGQFEARRGRASHHRSCIVRGAVFATLGALGFTAAVRNLAEPRLDLQTGALGLVMVGLATVALAGYALQLWWSLGGDELFG
ncbi:MAG: hypothetical protein HYZ29_29890 [Myxococcales bacterium]|nr:hypothetical protein [Myxococcales bacterium]